VGRDEIGRAAMDGAGPIAILEAPAGALRPQQACATPGSAGRNPPDQRRALTCLATRIKRPRPRPRQTKIAMEGRVPKGRSDGVWALGAAGTNSFQQSWLTEVRGRLQVGPLPDGRQVKGLSGPWGQAVAGLGRVLAMAGPAELVIIREGATKHTGIIAIPSIFTRGPLAR
jgi:hypothetical protein